MQTIQNNNGRIFRALVAASLLVLTACVQNADDALIEQLSLANFNHPERMVYASGQPTPDQIAALADAGVRHVVSLRTEGEIDWDEGAVVRQNGMQFYSIPVSGRTGVTSANAESLEQLLAQLDGEPVLLHCGSSNRVGALRAVTARDNGASIDDAIAEGRRWGLTGMEQRVRDVLSSN